MREDPKDDQQSEEGKDALDNSASDSLSDWMKTQLGTKAAKVKVTRRLESHPCVITIEEMAAGRHFIKTQGANFTEEQRYNILGNCIHRRKIFTDHISSAVDTFLTLPHCRCQFSRISPRWGAITEIVRAAEVMHVRLCAL